MVLNVGRKKPAKAKFRNYSSEDDQQKHEKEDMKLEISQFQLKHHQRIINMIMILVDITLLLHPLVSISCAFLCNICFLCDNIPLE